MEWSKIIGPGIGAVATIILYILIQKGMKKLPKIDEKGSFLLRQPKFYKYLGIAGMLFAILMGFIVDQREEDIEFVGTIAVVSLLFIPFFFIFLFEKNSWVKYDEQGVEANSLINKRSQISWEEIDKIKFNLFTQGIAIKSQNCKISVYQSSVGLLHFVKFLNQKGWSNEKMKIPKNLFGEEAAKKK